jgi:hypothetical protein
MELRDLKVLIDDAIDDCQVKINENPKVVLSEGDFERLLSFCIENILEQQNNNEFGVHTQISHYFDTHAHLDRRVDILLLKENEIYPHVNHKEFYYNKDSFAIELKYLHRKDSVMRVLDDFRKRGELGSNSWLYVIVLLDSSNDKIYAKRKGKIEEMKKIMIDYNKKFEKNLFCKVMKKEI